MWESPTDQYNDSESASTDKHLGVSVLILFGISQYIQIQVLIVHS